MIQLLNLNYRIKHSILTSFFLILISCGQGMNEQQMLQNAKTYMDKGELRAAAIELRNTLQKNNENAEARYLLGSIALDIGDLASAEKEFRRAALSGWNEEQTQTGLARIFITRKKFQKLLDEIVIINTWSADTRANISALRALAEASLGHIPQAKTTLDEGKAHKENAFQVLKTTAIFQLSGIQDGDASLTLKQALSHYPENPELLLLQASNDLRNKNLKQAANTFRKVISLDPAKLITLNGRSARISLARLQIMEKNYDEANTTLLPLLKRNDKDPEANYLGGLLAFSHGDYPRAEEHMRKLLKLVPNHNPSQQLMGNIKYALQDFDQAAQYLSTYLNKSPDNLAVYKLLIKTYIALHQPGQAKSTIQTALSISPDDADILTLLSQIEFKQGNINAANQALRTAIKSNPNNIALHKQLAKAYITAGKTEQALIEIQTFENLSKDSEAAQKFTIQVYMQAGEVNKAIDIANKMLIQKPQDPDIISLNGSLYAASENYQQARLHFNKALQLQESLPSASIGLARLERKDGNLDKAIELYKTLVESDKAGTIPMLALAELAAQQGRTNDMLSWLERARNASPTETKSRAILANYYLRNAQAKKADIYIQEAIKISPEQVELLALYGKILIAQKRYSEALPPLKKLVSKLPGSSNARTLLGETFLRLKMIEAARKQLQTALKIQENNIVALSLLAETELKKGNYDQSMAYAKNLQKAQAELYTGHMLEGDVWLVKQDYNKAHLAYSNAWKRQPSAKLAKRLFFASKHKENFENAIKPLLSWLADHPNDYSTRLFLADAYLNAQQNDNAIQEYEKVLKKTTSKSTVLNNLAWLYSLKDNPKALDFAERAYRLTQTNPGILDTYGWILVQQGQAVKGQRLLEQAMEQIPDSLEIRYHYAVALIKSGNINEGRQSLKKLLKEGKTFIGRKEAQQLLGKQESSK